MQQHPEAAPRSWLARLFLSPEERRPRVAWRLLLHGILMLVLVTLFSTPVALLMIVVAGLREGLLPIGPEGLLFESPWTVAATYASGLALVAATWIARRAIDRRTLRSLGLRFDRWTLRDLAFGFLVSGLMMGTVYGLELRLGWLRLEGVAWETAGAAWVLQGLVGGLAVYVAVGFQEELISRGYQLQNLVEGLNLGWGIFLSSAFFAVWHLGNPHAGLASTLGILAAGLFLAYPWVRTRQLWLSIGLHTGWNFFEGTVFGFPVSGLEGFRLIRHTVTGPDLWTGGSFGPEAGLVLLPALALGLLLIAVYTRGRASAQLG